MPDTKVASARATGNVPIIPNRAPLAPPDCELGSFDRVAEKPRNLL